MNPVYHRLPPVLGCALVTLVAFPHVSAAVTPTAHLRSGDLLVGSLFNPPGVLHFRDGGLVQTLSGNQPNIRAASYTVDRKVVTTWDVYIQGPSGLFVFDPATGTQTSITTQEVVLPGDVSVASNGNYIVNDQWGQDVDVYSPSGMHLQRLTAPPLVGGDKPPMGNTIAPDGSLWVTLARNQDVLHFASTGSYLGSFRPGFNPGDIVVDPIDGSLWFPNIDSNTVHQFTPQGQPLSSFPTLLPQQSQSFHGIAMTPNRELFVASTASNLIYRYDRQGNLRGSINAPPGSYLVFMNVVVPEPSAAALAMLCVTFQGLVRARSNRHL